MLKGSKADGDTALLWCDQHLEAGGDLKYIQRVNMESIEMFEFEMNIIIFMAGIWRPILVDGFEVLKAS